MSGNHLPALSKIRIDWFHSLEITHTWDDQCPEYQSARVNSNSLDRSQWCVIAVLPSFLTRWFRTVQWPGRDSNESETKGGISNEMTLWLEGVWLFHWWRLLWLKVYTLPTFYLNLAVFCFFCEVFCEEKCTQNCMADFTWLSRKWVDHVVKACTA